MNKTITSLYISVIFFIFNNLVFADYPSGEQLFAKINEKTYEGERDVILSFPGMGDYKVINLSQSWSNAKLQQVGNPKIRLDIKTMCLFREKIINGITIRTEYEFEQRPYKIEKIQGTENRYILFNYFHYKTKGGKEKIAPDLEIIGQIELEKIDTLNPPPSY